MNLLSISLSHIFTCLLARYPIFRYLLAMAICWKIWSTFS